ncbi:MAG: cellulase family glycosylhydrolase, partial [Ekhidna sp.]|nr:cellulase family glycosylhydrolase [Ekhidna sp.]
MVNDKPFEIKGATFGYDEQVPNYGYYFNDLKSLGVNTIRTWATGENTQALLDSAKAYGIKVMVGIWMRHGKPGMEADDSFDYLKDKSGMEAMYDNAIQVVEQYKDHPAVLTWGVGNEVYLNMETDTEKEAYSKLLERICAKIKAIDSKHPIVSVEAWTFGLDWWEKWVPSIDIYGINCYGPGANMLQDELDKREIVKPYVITEFGVTGEWESPKDENEVI